MSNLKDIEVLEILSLGDLDQVIGGGRCNVKGNGKSLGRVKRLNKFGCLLNGVGDANAFLDELPQSLLPPAEAEGA